MLPSFALSLGLAVQAAIPAGPASAGPISLENRFVRSVPEAGADAAAYVAIGNDGDDDRLVAVSCACAERVEIHRIIRSGDDVSMDTEADLAVPRRSVVEVRPGSDLHLMLIATRAPLAAGEAVEMLLRFERAGELVAPFIAVDDTRAAWSGVARSTPSDR